MVIYLKYTGLSVFAFSYDERYERANLPYNLLESIKLCEEESVYYQIIFTGITLKEVGNIICDFENAIGDVLRYLIPVTMELVDIGGASELMLSGYNWQSNKCSCDDRGFIGRNTYS